MELEYTRSIKSEKAIAKICKIYPEHFAGINPKTIVVLNMEGGRRQKFIAQIRPISKLVRFFMDPKYDEKIYVITVNCDAIRSRVEDDKKKYVRFRNAVLFHELFHIDQANAGKLLPHNVYDFTQVLKILGITLWENKDKIPNILKRGSND